MELPEAEKKEVPQDTLDECVLTPCLAENGMTAPSRTVVAHSHLTNRHWAMLCMWPVNAPIPKGMKLHTVSQVVSICFVAHTLRRSRDLIPISTPCTYKLF